MTKDFEYDKVGNLLKDDKASYSYDAFNRTAKVVDFDGNIQINHYDAEGLRHEMEENGKLVSFIFRGTEVVAEEVRRAEYVISERENCLLPMRSAQRPTTTMHPMSWGASPMWYPERIRTAAGKKSVEAS